MRHALAICTLIAARSRLAAECAPPRRGLPAPACALAACAALLATGLSAPARAYRTAADDLGADLPMRREQATLQILVRRGGARGLSDEAVSDAVAFGARAWRLGCTPFEIVLMGTSESDAREGDGVTTVQVVDRDWTARGYRADQAAVTELRLTKTDDHVFITDADIFLNADTIEWSTSAAPDLRAVLLHELGHAAFGLAHPCETMRGAGPMCTDAHRSAAVMFPDYQAGAWEPRADDAAGACALELGSRCASVTCGAGAYCADGQCVEAPTCAHGDECPEGSCAVAGVADGMCIPPRSDGAPCNVGEDCASLLCLNATDDISYCTHACNADGDCAASQRCRLVGGSNVCAPPSPSGCSATPGSQRAPLPAAVMLLAFLWLRFATRRRREIVGAR